MTDLVSDQKATQCQYQEPPRLKCEPKRVQISSVKCTGTVLNTLHLQCSLKHGTSHPWFQQPKAFFVCRIWLLILPGNALDGRNEVLGSDQQKQVNHCFLGFPVVAFNQALGWSQTLIRLPFIVNQRKDTYSSKIKSKSIFALETEKSHLHFT